jgi:hypothetical protein
VEAGDWLLGSDVTENCSAIIVYISIDPRPQLANGSEDAICTTLQKLSAHYWFNIFIHNSSAVGEGGIILK